MGNDFKKRAVESKPRERIEEAGSASVASAAELLAVIIKTGTVGCDVMELSRRLIDAFGSADALVKTDLNTLRSGIKSYNDEHPNRKIVGLGRVKTLLDPKRRPLSEPQTIAIGTLNGVNVHPRDVFSIAVRWNAHSIVVSHNHPSGSSLPSKRDVDLTWGLYGAGKMTGIPLVDHIIITNKTHYSFADNGRLSEK